MLLIREAMVMGTQHWELEGRKIKTVTEEEFRIQEAESIRDSVRQDGESRFKAPDFNRETEKSLSVTVIPDLGYGYSEC